MSYAKELKKKLGDEPHKRKKQEPLWKGPEEDGITFSLLSRFLSCRERFRIMVVEGLKPAESFNHRIEYGNMWHVCEEALAAGVRGKDDWSDDLKAYATQLCRKYPTQQEQIDHWYNVCKVQFPLYVDWWSKHPDVKDRTPLLQEQVFDVPYKLPSGRTVRLRGKWDSVDLVGKGKSAGVYLQENKTKGDIDDVRMVRQLSFDLQTMMYLVALDMSQELDQFSLVPNSRAKGVRYNVVRRPLSGGKGSIKQHQPTKSNPRGESKAEFYARLAGIIREDPGFYFMRWKVEISVVDINNFRCECLDPILEQLCDWWEWIGGAATRGVNFWDNDTTFNGKPWSDGRPHASAIHWRHPFGVYNPLDEGNASDLDEYLASGSEVGLRRCESLFPELEGLG